jgi:hypothetical protein
MKSKKLYQLRFVALLAVLSLAGAPRLLAQSAGTAGVAGTVTDPSGAAVPQVTVTLTSADTGQSRTAVTGSDGAYRFTLLPPGAYSVRFSAQGFRSADVSGLQLTVTETAVLNRSLEVGAQTDSVTVEATSTLGTTVGSRTVTDLPLANRNYTQIIGLSAGGNSAVTNATSFGKSTLDISVNGNTNLQNNFQMDGVSIGSMGTGGRADDNGVFVGIPIINPDAIQEFKIQTST